MSIHFHRVYYSYLVEMWDKATSDVVEAVTFETRPRPGSNFETETKTFP